MSSQLQVTGEAKIRDIQGPVVANSGVITALDGAASQYVRGDGTLADFPTSTGGGSSVSYYLNSSVSQGTIGGVAYRQLGKTPIAGVGTDIAISANGYVASYLTDANDPALLEVPAGNFNCEFYFSVNNNTGNPFVYAEVYKYDGTTFTLIGTSVGVPEYINQGTVINPYYFAVPVAQSVLTVTDRIAIRIYVNVDGRTVTLHTENNHLCQVVTTFSKGLISLNNLTRQNQFFATGTSGTDFGISSSVATHTFNLPIASATNTGKLSSTDWSTFNNKIGGSGTINTIPKFTAADTIGNSNLTDNGNTLKYEGSNAFVEVKSTNNSTSLRLEGYASATNADYGLKEIEMDGYYSSFNSYFGYNNSGAQWRIFGYADNAANTTNRGTTTWQIPSLDGTYGYFDVKSQHSATPIIRAFASNNVVIGGSTNNTFKLEVVGTTKISGVLTLGSTISNGTNTYTLPSITGTLALTSDLTAYVPYTGATGSVNLGLYELSAQNAFLNGVSGVNGGNLFLRQDIDFGQSAGYTTLYSTGKNLGFVSYVGSFTYNALFSLNSLTNNSTRTYTLPDLSGTLALLEGTQTFSGAKTFSLDILVNSLTIGRGGSAVVGNTAIGLNSLFTNTTGVNNSALGNNSLRLNTTGGNNTAIGVNALQNNTTASFNTAIGNNSLNSNTTGTSNTAIGSQSLTANTTGFNNTAIGDTVLGNSTTASNNVAIGYGSGVSITTGSNNTLITGGGSITTGSNNTIIGNYAGTTTLANNIVLADGAGNIRYQWNGTNNVFGNPISGTSATFSSSVTATSAIFANGSVLSTVMGSPQLRLINNAAATANQRVDLGLRWEDGTYNGIGGISMVRESATARSGTIVIQPINSSGDPLAALSIASTGAATFSSTLQVNSYQIINGASAGFTFLQFNNNGTPIGYTGSAAAIVTGGSASDYALATAQNIVFGTGGSFTEKMRITSGGNVGIGTSSPISLLEVRGATPFIRITDTAVSAESGLVMDATGGLIRGGLTINYGTGEFKSFCGVAGNSYFQTFHTNGSERMRITSVGDVLVGATSVPSGAVSMGAGSVFINNNLYIGNTAGTGGYAVRFDGYANALYAIWQNASGTDQGGVYLSYGATSWTANSDLRLKDINGTIDNALDKIMTLRPVNFSWKSDETKKEMLGLIAQDVEKVFPQLIDENRDGYMGVRYQELVPVLIAAIQEQQAQIEELSNKIVALESK